MMRKECGCALCAQDESASHKGTETRSRKVSISSSVTQPFIVMSELHNCMEHEDIPCQESYKLRPL
jgi:hypothetical protein